MAAVLSVRTGIVSNQIWYKSAVNLKSFLCFLYQVLVSCAYNLLMWVHSFGCLKETRTSLLMTYSIHSGQMCFFFCTSRRCESHKWHHSCISRLQWLDFPLPALSRKCSWVAACEIPQQNFIVFMAVWYIILIIYNNIFTHSPVIGLLGVFSCIFFVLWKIPP